LPESPDCIIWKTAVGIWNHEHNEELTARARSRNDHFSSEFDAFGKMILHMMLDFFKFDPLATELDLRISAPEQPDRPIWIVLRKISCPIESPVVLGG
jgi:hypothetical protein